MRTGTGEDKTEYCPRKRIVVIFDSPRAGELLDILAGAGAQIDLVNFISPVQVAWLDRIMQNDGNYMPQ